MNRRFMLALAGMLAIAACNDQQEPSTAPSSTGPAFASSTASIGINVVLKAPATAANRAELAKYGNLMDEIPELNAIRVKSDASKLSAIKGLSFVKDASPDAERQAIPIDLVAAEDFVNGANAWDQDAVDVSDFGQGRTTSYTGSGVNLAILDTGLLPTWQQYFPQQRILSDYATQFGGGGAQNSGNVSSPTDKWDSDVDSHGTHVASTILGYQFPISGQLTQFTGTAPQVNIIPVKVLNQNGSGWSSPIARGINYVAHLKRDVFPNQPMVVNMSLGGSAPDALEKAAIDDAVAAGVIIVASAGNRGDAGMGYPGAFPNVISAAAAGWTKQWTPCAGTNTGSSWWRLCDVSERIASESYIADFSSREKAGQDLDVAAPGAWVVGPYQTNQSNRMSLFFLSGTSMASPHVAGIVALMAQKKPSLTAAQAEYILEKSATPLDPGCVTVNDIAPAEMCWGADATGAGLATATAALAATH